jgi:hypothetical protein
MVFGQVCEPNSLFLGRLMIHPDGFAADPAFRVAGAPLIDVPRPLVYDGNSLGGIPKRYATLREVSPVRLC